MKLKEFKEWFAEFSAGIPVEGPNSAQWKKLKSVADSLEVEAEKPVVKAPVEKK